MVVKYGAQVAYLPFTPVLFSPCPLCAQSSSIFKIDVNSFVCDLYYYIGIMNLPWHLWDNVALQKHYDALPLDIEN